MIAKVAVSVANYTLDKPYDYLIPELFLDRIAPGIRVFVPFGKGNRVSDGVVLSVAEQSDYPDCKELIRPADQEPILTEQQLKLAMFMRERYFCTVYQAVRSMLPIGYWFDRTGKQKDSDRFLELARLSVSAEDAMRYAEEKGHRASKQREILELLCSFGELSTGDLLHFTGAGRPVLKRLAELELIELFEQEVLRKPEIGSFEPQPLPVLNPEQNQVLSRISGQILQGQGTVGLLSGVTGSGKTCLYAHLIDQTIQRGKGVILLVPEISLTPQMLEMFSSWFGERIAVLHSGLSSGERFDEWKRIKRGEAKLVIGTRSAVFAPVSELGLIIIDEEQEDSYASEAAPRYHAREVARFRCYQENASLLLGSATPDIRSRYRAQTGEFFFYQLQHRYNDKPLPPVHIVDMKKELLGGNTSFLSSELKDAIIQRIERQEQTILFLNRRGTSKLVTCTSCGFIYQCPHCSVSMTWHANRRRLICHYCGTAHCLDTSCPKCGGAFSFFGIGTQMVEAELHELFPSAGVMRVDADSVSPSGSHRELFRRFVRENIPIMVGTQMIAKGLNFENVTLTGVLSADQSLYTNDFRSGEKTFSLLTQVIGRSGRSVKSGEAYIQTFTPDNEIIRLAARQDYEAFYQREIEMRRLQNAPPFYEWVALSATGTDEQRLLKSLQKCKNTLEEMLRGVDEVQILGPVPMAIVKMNDRYRYRLQICCRMNRNIRRVLASVLVACSQDREMKKISFFIENEPIS